MSQQLREPSAPTHSPKPMVPDEQPPPRVEPFMTQRSPRDKAELGSGWDRLLLICSSRDFQGKEFTAQLLLQESHDPAFEMSAVPKPHAPFRCTRHLPRSLPGLSLQGEDSAILLPSPVLYSVICACLNSAFPEIQGGSSGCGRKSVCSCNLEDGETNKKED